MLGDNNTLSSGTILKGSCLTSIAREQNKITKIGVFTTGIKTMRARVCVLYSKNN